MIIGVDIGYSSTKTSEGKLFESKISEVDNISECETITIDGKKYSVGKGIGTVEVNKVDNELTRVCLFSALAMSSYASNFKLVTGLPISQYESQGDKLKQMIEDRKKARIIYNNYGRDIIVDTVKIYPQGAGALFAYNIRGNAILVDIGSRTIDIALFEVHENKRMLIKSVTLYSGVLPLYSKVVDEVNKRFDTGLNISYGEQLLRNELIIDGEHQSKHFIKDVCIQHLSELFAELDLNYPIRTTPIYLVGGGAYILGDYIKLKYKRVVVLENAQFANAVGFKKVGEKIWQG